MRVCHSNYDSCPCRAIDLRIGISTCNFVYKFGILLISSDKRKIDHFLKNVCPEKRNEVLNHDYVAKELRRLSKEFLEQVKPGDLVFCTADLDDVIFLEYPTYEHGNCKYKTIQGEIYEVPTFCFRNISKGNKLAIYKTKSKNKAEDYARLARRNGYRIELEKDGETFLVKIHGDKQKDVDDFLINLESGLILDNLYDF